MTTCHPTSPRDAVSHLTPERWEQANRLLLRTALAELSHERLISPVQIPGDEAGRSTATSDDGTPSTTGRSTPTASPVTGTATNCPSTHSRSSRSCAVR